MENSLKQRIIGAIVLIALAIIFLPAILKDKANSGTFESKIPAKPKELADYRVDTKKIDQLVENQENDKKQPPNEISSESKQQVKQQDAKTQEKKLSQSINPDKSANRKKKLVDSEKADNENNNSGITSPPEKSKISEKYQDAAWVVQVASFSRESNAKNMVSKLKASNYKAYRRKVISGSSKVYRVFVGPYIEKSDARKVLSDISKLSESSAILKPFDPIKH